jgi:alanyl-tRNA synthetase
MKLDELRESFLTFFESKKHLRLKSFSLIPNNDNSLLFINSGMAPMKKFFMENNSAPKSRVVTSQRCVRTLDIDLVGKTSRHGTYFEMLGNFSFGDYFKKEAINWAFEFLCEVAKLPKEKLVISVFEEDEEAYKIWKEKINPEKIMKFDRKNNFWEHGKGPCGPCSEIYFDKGKKYGCKKENCNVDCDCERYIELWNLVFTQFLNDGNGSYSKLKSPNIDTGLGLERLACVVQGVDNFFLIDSIKNILKFICKKANIIYGHNEKNDTSVKIIADHIRSIVFMAFDKVIPSNEGRGYVMRKLVRRAIRYGKIIGFNNAFLYKICDAIIEENKTAYPELLENASCIKKIILLEEENFLKTMNNGLNVLEEMLKNIKNNIMSGKDAFLLHDTHGFPIDLTIEILNERGFSVNIEEFNELIEKQKKMSNIARNTSCSNDTWGKKNLILNNNFHSEYIGYNAFSSNSKVIGIFLENNSLQSISLDKNKFYKNLYIILNKTPFSAEGGGQASDTGRMFSENVDLKVIHVEKNSSVYIHECSLKSGTVEIGDILKVNIDVDKRKSTQRNHTAAHMLHSTLRIILGNHVYQSGQFVNDKLLRFDFTHSEKLTKNQLNEIEKNINLKILDAISVETTEMPIEKARKLNAMALFEEKYGDVVRVVQISDFSSEFCSGTHVSNTSEICLFKIINETSVGSGIRRIEALTGACALELFKNCNEILEKAKKILKQNDLIKGIENLLNSNKENADKLKKLEIEICNNMAKKFLSDAKKIKLKKTDNIIKIVVGKLKEIQTDVVRHMCDNIVQGSENIVAIIFLTHGDKLLMMVFVSKSAQKIGLHAGNLVRILAKFVDGSGGGTIKFGTAGIKLKQKLPDLLKNIDKEILAMICLGEEI